GPNGCCNGQCGGGCPNGNCGCPNGNCAGGGYGPGGCGPQGCGPGGCGAGGLGPGGYAQAGNYNCRYGCRSACAPIPNLYAGQQAVDWQLGGPAGPPSAQVSYPYYTTRGPRDFFANHPPTIGP